MILVVVAHPDDESLFCGATIAKHVQDRDEVRVVACSDGVGSRYWYPGKSDVDLNGPAESIEVKAREEAFVKACAILGATGTIQIVFPDQLSDTVPQLQINQAVALMVSHANPELVYTHHIGDGNGDHRCVADAVLKATRPSTPVRYMAHEFPERRMGPKFKPTYKPFVGSEAWSKKVAACMCYETEIREYPHPRSERALRSRPESFMEIR